MCATVSWFVGGLLLETRSIRCEQICIIAHWALKGGCADPVSKIALHPAASSGRFKRKLRSYLKLDRDVDQTYTVYAPGYSKAEMSRVQLALPFMPPYELLHKEWCESENLDERLQECIDSGDMPLTYDSHPVVLGTSELVHAAVMYADGVPTTKSDGVIGFWIYFWSTGYRHLMGVVRKSQLCRCGLAAGVHFGNCLDFQVLHASAR